VKPKGSFVEVPSVAAPPSHAPARAAQPAGFVERALAHQRRPLGPLAAGADASPGSGFGFDDLLDIVNPLQHVPIVSAAYRSVTDDEISPVPRLLGGALFGGLVGLAVAAANTALERITGRDAGEHVVAALFGGSDPSEPEAIMVASADPERAGPGQPAPPATADGPAPAQAAQAQAQAGAPRPWYVAGLQRSDNEPATTQAAAAPEDGAPGALAAASPRQSAPEPARRPSRLGAEPLPRGPASVVSRLTPAQVELLLASVGQRAPAEAVAEAGIPQAAVAASPAEASGETRPLEPLGDGRASGSGPVAERIRRGLEAYRSAGGLLAQSGPGASTLR
jgi:hypothetical protein